MQQKKLELAIIEVRLDLAGIATGGNPMDEVRSLFWRLATVTFIVVSVVSAMAYLAASAIY